jgi:hypothetical protein
MGSRSFQRLTFARPLRLHRLATVFLFALLLAGCLGEQPSADLRVRVFVDGKQLTLSTGDPLTVGQLLERNNITLGEQDRIEPADFKLVEDNMTITIVRVRDEPKCETQEVPYSRQEVPTYDLQPGETRVLKAGINGEARVCFNILYEDNVEKSRAQTSNTVVREAEPQLIAVGIDNAAIEPRDIPGVLVYLSAGQANYIDGSTKRQGVLPTGGNLDGKVFAPSPDGRQLLFTRRKSATSATGSICNEDNELWLLLNIRDLDAQPIKIGTLFNVKWAEWVPGQANTFSYSTFTPRPDIPCFTALNDVILARVDSASGGLVGAEPIVPTKQMGQYGAWGISAAWSPDGRMLAWANAEALGVVDLQRGEYVPLVTFPVFTTTLSQGWLWKPSIAWSQDGNVVAASVHGKPYNDLPAETSPIFDIALVQVNNAYRINPAVEQAGMWAAPRFSFFLQFADGKLQSYKAYLKARTPLNSVSGEYDLVIADRDGSNPRSIFPGKEREGLKPINDGSEFAWSPDVRSIAVVYQGDIYLVDVNTGNATRATLVGNATMLRWVG